MTDLERPAAELSNAARGAIGSRPDCELVFGALGFGAMSRQNSPTIDPSDV